MSQEAPRPGRHRRALAVAGMPRRTPGVLALILLGTLALAAVPGARTPRRAEPRENNEGSGGDHPSANAASGGHFDYASADDWPRDFPGCAGPRQSPIDINLLRVEVLESRPPLRSYGYDGRPLKMRVTNNGHSAQLNGEWPEFNAPTIFGGPLTGLYEFAQLHFHWGADNNAGSEHTVSKQSYPLEMHLVHWKKGYGNMSEALKHDDGIAVVGYIMSLAENENAGIEKIQSGFKRILKPLQSAEIEPFPLSLLTLDLLDEGYVTYLGSLTTPPCFESVIWILAVRVTDVTIDEVELFRQLKLSRNDTYNYRPTQNLNGRVVYYLNENIVN